MTKALGPKQLGSAGGAGILYYATDYDFATSSVARLTSSNATSVEADLESLNRVDLGDFDTPVFTTTKENENTYRSARCGRGIYARLETKKDQLSFNWIDAGDPEKRAKFQGGFFQASTASPVSISDPDQELLTQSGASIGQFFFTNRSNADNTVITAVTVNQGGTVNANGTVTGGTSLTSGTDYEILVNSQGKSYISFLTTQTGVLSVEYTYTPAEKEYDGYNFQASRVPFVALKFVQCDVTGFDLDGNKDDSKAIVRTRYITKTTLSNDFAEQFYNLDNETLEGLPVEFTGEEGGLILRVKSEVSI